MHWRIFFNKKKVFTITSRLSQLRIDKPKLFYSIIKYKKKKVFKEIIFNPIRPGLLLGIKSQGGEGGTKNHTFEKPLLIVKMLLNLV